MTPELALLVVTAASIGFFHTLLGPDHYLPFIVMAQARKWSLSKTIWITFFCGLGHVASSVVIGLIGVAIGISVTKLETLESSRGSLAAWLLIVFGALYFAWGIKKAFRYKPHQHVHTHQDRLVHTHRHVHTGQHLHVHEEENAKNITPWILFTIFVFGPCEPLIPILIYPAAKIDFFGLFLVVLVFGLTTIGTMLGVVLCSSFGLSFASLKRIERYTHAIAGATICLCGVGIQFLGL